MSERIILAEAEYRGFRLSVEDRHMFPGMTESCYRIGGFLLRGRYGETMDGMKRVVDAILENAK